MPCKMPSSRLSVLEVVQENIIYRFQVVLIIAGRFRYPAFCWIRFAVDVALMVHRFIDSMGFQRQCGDESVAASRSCRERNPCSVTIGCRYEAVQLAYFFQLRRDNGEVSHSNWFSISSASRYGVPSSRRRRRQPELPPLISIKSGMSSSLSYVSFSFRLENG